MSRLLAPRSIAVFGGRWAAAVIRQTRRMGYAGRIWPVHPDKDTVEELPAFRSVADLPAAPDAAFVGVNRRAAIGIVGELAELGAGGAVCFASGFREADAGDVDAGRLQDELVLAAGDMPILGPNCYGLINYRDGALLWPDEHGGVRLDEGARGVAIVTQSSNIAINMTMQARGLPIAYVLTAGNQAQTGISEVAAGLLEDDRVSALGLHIEGFDSARGYEQLAARARELGKPIVAMKVGKTEKARAATVTHTASLAGTDAASDAFLRRLGIGRVSSVPTFLETLKLLHFCGPLDGSDISSMSCSGGEAALMADAGENLNVNFRTLTETANSRLKRSLGPLVAIANPFDYSTFIWNDEAAMTEVFSAVVSDGFNFNFLVIDFPRADRCSDTDWHSCVRSFADALKKSRAKGAVLASLPENLPEDWSHICLENAIVPMHGLDDALASIETAASIGRAWNGPVPGPVAGDAHAGKPGRTLDEAEAKRMLRDAGLPVPAGKLAGSVSETLRAAEEVGYPVVLKALGVAHKSEHGAVRLDLSDRRAVENAANELIRSENGLLVERHVASGVAELIVGITSDPLFGPVMTIGAGGVLVELLNDNRTLLLPATRREIDEALRSLKLFPLLDGYRGRPLADVEAAIDAIDGLSRFAQRNNGRIKEMDINPLIVCEHGQGVAIADALIVTAEITT